MPRDAKIPAQRGFSLIEALVATTLSAVLLGTVMQSLSGAGRLSDRASKRSAAMILAQKVINGRPVNQRGNEGQLRWERVIKPQANTPRAELVSIRVEVTSPKIKRPVELTAMRVVQKW